MVRVLRKSPFKSITSHLRIKVVRNKWQKEGVAFFSEARKDGQFFPRKNGRTIVERLK